MRVLTLFVLPNCITKLIVRWMDLYVGVRVGVCVSTFVLCNRSMLLLRDHTRTRSHGWRLSSIIKQIKLGPRQQEIAKDGSNQRIAR